MKTIETTVMVDESRHLSLQLPLDIEPGSHKIVVIIDALSSDRFLEPLHADLKQNFADLIQHIGQLSTGGNSIQDIHFERSR